MPGGLAGAEPSAVEWQRLRRGEAVVRTREIPGYPWPEVSVRRVVAAPPEAVMAVYADFGGQAAWAPRVVESRIVATPAPRTLRVFYEYDTPGPNERYTVEITLARDGDAWEAAWMLVEGRYARRLAGRLRAAPAPGGTLLTYENRVDPGRLGVAFGSSRSVELRLVETLAALDAHVERLRRIDPVALAERVLTLRALAAGRPPPATP